MPGTFKEYLERNIKKVVTKFTDMIQDVTPFIGTEAEWNALSAAEQAKYNIKDIIGEGGDYGPGIAPAWFKGETYAVGDIRLWSNGHTYVCKLAHTSSSSITPANTTYWEDKTLGEMISSVNSNYTNIGILKKGNTTISEMICSGYNTGSGNYIDFWIPIPVDTSEVTSISLTSAVDIAVFTKDGRTDVTTTGGFVYAFNKYGIFIELCYSSTMSKNIPANVRLTGLAVACS